MKALIVASVCAALLAALPGCTYYVAPGTPVPGYPSPSTFDRSFSAASGAMRDQGLEVTWKTAPAAPWSAGRAKAR